MKVASTVLALVALTQTASAHYIFNTLIAGGTTSSAAVRQPRDNMPIKPVTSASMRCNVNPGKASATVNVAAGSAIGFKLDANIYHAGPAAIYLGKAPGSAASWDGSGANWFKIAEWGATFNPFAFKTTGKTELTTTIPKNTPSGEYLVRVEQLGMHITPPESFVSCAQIKVTNGGSGNPPKVSIPGYIKGSDPAINVNIYWPVPSSYRVPGPAVWRG
ncbi:putative endo-beta-1,4-glucanase D [Hypsizygus marmoreus]|uniref:AA9 family lytic polysaccharide monooxygenase n=1 Tax=Hypsizygus marmoreus TaxID=39966 RepID=A0A369J9U3_HYPMA|nr:putative endo-beta-1,4-glucanase D [Hypsizygus marmoreus]